MQDNTLAEMLPRYQWVRWELERELADQEVGQKVISENELVKKFKVSRVTARKALQILRKDGIIKCIRGRGTFLSKVPSRSRTAVPNTKARLLGVLVPSVDAPLIGAIVHGIESKASERGYHILLSHDHDDPDLQIRQLRKMLDTDVSGILLYPDRFVTDRTEFIDLLEEWKNRDIPLVLVDRYIAGLDFPCVMTDNVQGMYDLAEHLILCGRRRLALIGFWESNTVHMARRRGFLEALRTHRLPVHAVMEGHVSPNRPEDGTNIIKEWTQEAHDLVAGWIKGKSADELPFDAIVSMYDPMAYGAFSALQEAGIRVPEDVALVGYDNLDSGLYRAQGLQLTSVQQPLDLEGATAAEILIDRIENRPRSGRGNHVLLPARLVVRTSCGGKEAGTNAAVSLVPQDAVA